MVAIQSTFYLYLIHSSCVIRNIPTIQKGTFKDSVHTTPRALCQTDSFQSICKNRISAMRFDCQDILIRYTLDKTAGVTY